MWKYFTSNEILPSELLVLCEWQKIIPWTSWKPLVPRQWQTIIPWTFWRKKTQYLTSDKRLSSEHPEKKTNTSSVINDYPLNILKTTGTSSVTSDYPLNVLKRKLILHQWQQLSSEHPENHRYFISDKRLSSERPENHWYFISDKQ